MDLGDDRTHVQCVFYDVSILLLLLLLLLYIWQSPGLPGWRKVNLITVTHRPHHPSIAAGLYCLTKSPGLLPALCEKWSGFFYVHRVLLSYTRDRRLKVSSERLGNEDKAPCPRTLLPGRGIRDQLRFWGAEVFCPGGGGGGGTLVQLFWPCAKTKSSMTTYEPQRTIFV